ncbi:RING finger protein 222-like [Scleropages formosus]|uniref:RING finger protein 222-like n=1 Tax=Scleropages formosus TaxID=113540 RepID=UPI0010FABA41|nr:RING finger protein 222-like [Scleropages formosus]
MKSSCANMSASAPAEKCASDGGTFSECPVCYEPLEEDARTLSCGHVFCHGCLVRTLVTGAGPRAAARGSIVCPICRHLTFITPGLATHGKLPDKRQILEVPSLEAHAPLLLAEPPQPALFRFASSCTWLPGRLGRPRATHPARTTHIFVISNQGRPMAEEDQISVDTTTTTSATESLARRVRPNLCMSAFCVLLLLVTLSLLAGAAGVLRWVLLG